ncbi:hypothetical protein V2J09_020190 [Rumex salicifolius]
MAILSTVAPPQPLLPFHHRHTPYAPFLASNLALPSAKPTARSLICISSSSSPSTSVAEDEGSPPTNESGDTPPASDGRPLRIDENVICIVHSGCKACGREQVESGCNGEGRIQGGIATFPGLGWWPIKAYRPCPGFLASGGRYKRQGQSMDEVVSGAGKGRASTMN